MPAIGDTHRSVAVIGGGQAGLSMSYYLAELGVDHVVLERQRVGFEWRERRWDSFCLVTPNWQCQLPGFPYTGPEPDGFMPRDEIVRYLAAYAASFGPPLAEGAEVTRLRCDRDGTFELSTTAGDMTADQVVVATGPYQLPAVPPAAQRLPDSTAQLHSSEYRSAAKLPDGAVLVVGSGQSGGQIAEDLHLAGRRVHLSVGSAPRVARRYRGRDVVAWLDAMGYYDKAIGEFADADSVRLRANHYVTGRDGGHDIDLRALARAGLRLHGRLSSVTAERAYFDGDLGRNLDHADAVSESIKDSIDQFIAARGIDAPHEARYTPVWQPPDGPSSLAAADISAVVWCTGFGRDYRWIDVPVFDGRGYPVHDRGVTNCPGLYFLGLPWLHSWGSGRFSGIARDARHLAGRVVAHRRGRWTEEVRWIAGTPTETYPDYPRTVMAS
jgi:putative flavoprotein involved in K+ transport